jgi:hypothetical protein
MKKASSQKTNTTGKGVVNNNYHSQSYSASSSSSSANKPQNESGHQLTEELLQLASSCFLQSSSSSCSSSKLLEASCEEVLRGGEEGQELQAQLIAALLETYTHKAHLTSFLVTASASCRSFFFSAPSSSSRWAAWQGLVSQGVSGRKLTVVLYSLMMTTASTTTGSCAPKKRRLSFSTRAASLYLLLSRASEPPSLSYSSSSSSSSSTFHPLVFRQAVNLLLCHLPTKTKTNNNSFSKGNLKAFKKRRRNANEEEEEDEEDHDDEELDNEEEAEEEREAEKWASLEQLLGDLNDFLADPTSPLQRTSLISLSCSSSSSFSSPTSLLSEDATLSCIAHTVEVLTEAARTSLLPSIQEKCFSALSSLLVACSCSSNNEIEGEAREVTKTLAIVLPLVLKHLLPNLLGISSASASASASSSGDASLSATLPRHVVISRSLAIRFVQEHIAPLLLLSFSSPSPLHPSQQQEGASKSTNQNKKGSRKKKKEGNEEEENDDYDEESPKKRKKTTTKKEKKNPKSTKEVLRSSSSSSEDFAGDAYLALLEHLCVRVPEKSEYRSQTANAIVQLLFFTSPSSFCRQQEQRRSSNGSRGRRLEKVLSGIASRFMPFLEKLSQSSRMGARTFAVELTQELLLSASASSSFANNNYNNININTSEDDSEDLTTPSLGLVGYKVLVGLLLQRASDKAPTVRAKAFSALSLLLPLATITNNYTTTSAGEKRKTFDLKLRSALQSRTKGVSKLLFSTEEEEEGEQQQQQHIQQELFEVSLRRVSDEKYVVRKGTLSLLLELSCAALLYLRSLATGQGLSSSSSSLSAETVRGLLLVLQQSFEVFQARCADTSVAIRKQAMTGLTHLMKLHHHGSSRAHNQATGNSTLEGVVKLAALGGMGVTGKALRSSWLGGCMPIAVDPESTAVDAYLDLFDSLLLNPIRTTTTLPRTTTLTTKDKRGKGKGSQEEEPFDDFFSSSSSKDEMELEEEVEEDKKSVNRKRREEMEKLELTWRLVAEMNGDGEASRYLTKTCFLLSTKGRVDRPLITKLLSWADRSATSLFLNATTTTTPTMTSPLRWAAESTWRLLAEIVSAPEPTSYRSSAAAAGAAATYKTKAASWIDPGPVLRRWKHLKDSGLLSRVVMAGEEDQRMVLIAQFVQRLLEVIRGIASSNICSASSSFSVPLGTIRSLADDLLERLEKFDATPTLIRSFSTTLSHLRTLLISRQQHSNESSSTIDDWCSRLLLQCEERLSSLVLPIITTTHVANDLVGAAQKRLTTASTPAPSSPSPSSSKKFSECGEALKRYLFTLGEMAGLVASKRKKGKVVSKRTITLIQALLSFDRDNNNNNRQPPSRSTTTTTTAAIVPPSVRAFAVICLGKLCLEDESLAKSCVSAFAAELRTSPSPAVRNNSALVLCDLAVRYTALVEPYASDLALCLRDPCEPVRRQTLAMLSTLLQQDYLKWRASATSSSSSLIKREEEEEEGGGGDQQQQPGGHLFHRFLLLLVDPSLPIRRLALFTLLSRHRGSLHQHFVDSLFHLNGYHHHRNSSTSERRRGVELEMMFTLGGGQETQNRRDRMAIYQLLLQHMTEEQKFQVCAKLCQDILSAATDGNIDLDLRVDPEENNNEDNKEEEEQQQQKPTVWPGVDVLQDALDILVCKEIKLSSSRSASGTDDASEATPSAGSTSTAEEAMIAAAKGRLLTKVMKRNVIENIVPIVVELKHLLEQRRSPLLRSLMAFLRELMRDHREEVSDVLVADKRLSKELEYDLRQFDLQQHQQQRNTAAARTTSVPGVLASPRQQQQLPVATSNGGVVSSIASTPTSTGTRRTSLVVSANRRASIVLNSPAHPSTSAATPSTPSLAMARRLSSFASPALMRKSSLVSSSQGRPLKQVTFSPSVTTPRTLGIFSVPRLRPSPGTGILKNNLATPNTPTSPSLLTTAAKIAAAVSSSPFIAPSSTSSRTSSKATTTTTTEQPQRQRRLIVEEDDEDGFAAQLSRPLGKVSAKLKALRNDEQENEGSVILLSSPSSSKQPDQQQRWNLRQPTTTFKTKGTANRPKRATKSRP